MRNLLQKAAGTALATAIVATSVLPSEDGQTWITDNYQLQDYYLGDGSLVNGVNSDSLWINDSSSTTQNNTFIEKQAEQNYYLVVSRISELLRFDEDEETDEDDDEAVVPTDYALDRTLTVLSQTYEILRLTFPIAAATLSFDGGIRVQWMYPKSSVRLVIPGGKDKQEYIFFEDERDYETVVVSAEMLAQKLLWLQRVSNYVEIDR